jgi:hypothetical protein
LVGLRLDDSYSDIQNLPNSSELQVFQAMSLAGSWWN